MKTGRSVVSKSLGLERNMDMRLFEKSPHVAPLLVRLYDSQRLSGLAKDGSPLARAELTSAVVDLLKTDLGPRERELISDVLISLMRQAEQDLRQAIAERLAVLDMVPLRVVLHIANDDIEIASPVLRLSAVLSDLDLLYIIKSKGPEYWRAIAARTNLSAGVMDVLADTHEAGTLEALAANDKITLSPHALDVAAQEAETSESLARPLLMRADIPEAVARRLYAHVGAELKAYIRDYFGIHDEAVMGAIDDIVFEFSGQEAPAASAPKKKRVEFMPSEAALQAAAALAESGHLSMKKMMETLQRGQFASFIAMFSCFTGMSAERVHEMLSACDGRVLAVTCRANGLTKSDLSRIYMMTQRLRSIERIVDQKDLLNTLAIYDRVQIAEARRMLGMDR